MKQNVYFNHQSGQALIMMLAFILILAIATIYLFNTSQVLAERSQAKVLADHAAYNTAVKQAQLLNANAYMNKAKIANQLATAQAVSVSSWIKHFEPMPNNTQAINAIPYVGPQIQQGIVTTTKSMQQLNLGMDLNIRANNIATESISYQQKFLNLRATSDVILVPKQTLQKSSIGSGFDSELMYSASRLVGYGFIKNYQGDSRDPMVGRGRLKGVLLASRDNFTLERRKNSIQKLPIPIFRNRLEARGGTEVSDDLNQWKAVDTFSHHYRFWKKRKWRLPKLKWREDQIGYGSTVIRNEQGDRDPSNYAGYNSVRRNRDASRLSSSFRPSWDSRNSKSMSVGETGIPSYWDLAPKFLSENEPTLPIAVLVSKKPKKLNTTSGSSSLQVGSSLNIKSKYAVFALSTAETYFERPLTDRRGKQTFLNQNRLEKASLLNPYWNVRLVNNSTDAITEANIR